MSTNPTDPRRQYPSTYFVDRSNQDEMTRLIVQDRMITAAMGGVLPEQPDPTNFPRMLDVGCGTGDWLIAAAKTYPTMTRLVGIDVNTRMIEYAREQAKITNMRFATAFMRTWNWPKVLDEMQRVTRPGGVIRLTENECFHSSSPALLRILDISGDAFYRAGHLFSEGKTGDASSLGTIGVASDLARLLHQYGVQDIQTHSSLLEYPAGTPAGQSFAEDMRLAGRTIMPFVRKWGHLPDDYETLYQQMVHETLTIKASPLYAVLAELIRLWVMNT